MTAISTAGDVVLNPAEDWSGQNGPYPEPAAVHGVLIDRGADRIRFMWAGYYLGIGVPVAYVMAAAGEHTSEPGRQFPRTGGAVVPVTRLAEWVRSGGGAVETPPDPEPPDSTMTCPECGNPADFSRGKWHCRKCFHKWSGF